jgi:hypothetical protein
MQTLGPTGFELMEEPAVGARPVFFSGQNRLA